MKRHAKVSSAGSTMRQGSGLGGIVRRVLATRGVSCSRAGSGAPVAGRLGSIAVLVFAASVIFGATIAFAAGAPTVALLPPTHVNSDHAFLHGTVNPNGEATTYWFEYGLADCSANPCTSIPAGEDASAGEGSEPVAVNRAIGGLQAEATYHFRLVAENASGPSATGDQTFTTDAASLPAECPNEIHREEIHGQELPDCRAWELVSPPDKLGMDVAIDSGRIRVAESETGELPMAATFSSLGGFADVQGMGIGTEYMSQRTLEPGTSGWSTHGIFPNQDPMNVQAIFACQDPIYSAISADLSQGMFAAWSALGNEPNIQEVENLYRRDDLRAPGAGSYQLFTDSVNPVPPTAFGNCRQKPWFAGASTDLSHAVFEQTRNLTANAGGNDSKAYKSDEGALRLLTSGSLACPGGKSTASPCSVAGSGVTTFKVAHGAVSVDGSRVAFTSPVRGELLQAKGGVASRLFQLDDRGTPSANDDSLIQVSASEKPTPDLSQPATFLIGSNTGNRIFFKSQEQLTSAELAPGAFGLYLWERKDEPETQSITVDAEGGTLTLTGHVQSTVGTGDVTEGETTVSGVTAGSFMPGMSITGPGIPAGTTITAMGSFSNAGQSFLTLSQPPTETTASARLEADVEATTGALAFNASAAQVQSALEGLVLPAPFEPIPVFGEGNVSVSGGPGAPGGGSPYEISFIGGLNGVDVAPVSVDASGLSGGAETAQQETLNPITNLALVAPSMFDAVDSSSSGDRLYFLADEQLVPGGPDLEGTHGLFYWHSSEVPGSPLSFVGSHIQMNNGITLGIFDGEGHRSAEATPDGRFLYFLHNRGDLLASGYEHGQCSDPTFGEGFGSGLCTEAYVFNADSSQPLAPDVECVSCNLGSPGATAERGSVYFYFRTGTGGSGDTRYTGRMLSADGKRAFFTSALALVPEDTNGTLDAYEYDLETETPHLLSSGTSPDPSYYLNASGSGDDAFIVTRQQLSGWDTDGSYDLYDVRVDGSIPEPAPSSAACSGEACRPGATAAPEVHGAASAGLIGPENPSPHRRRCAKHQRRVVRRNGKSRCVNSRNRHRMKTRNANSNRRNGR